MPNTTNSELTSSNALIDERDLSRMLGVSVRTVQAWRVKGGGPAYLKLNNRLIRYRVTGIKDWLAGQARSNTSGGGLV
jgi:phage terminase Nu1 subunit (DNA packaging protein)